MGTGEYGLVTMHRPSNVDDEALFRKLISQIIEISEKLPLIFPVHPRTRQRMEAFDLLKEVERAAGITLLEPLGYIPFMSLVKQAKMVLTDSGGIQEETTYLNVPCLTIRENTERPITISQGTNALVGPDTLMKNAQKILDGDWPSGIRPELWDGKTAGRVAESIKKSLGI